MSRVGVEPSIPASVRGKTVHALDRSATVTGFKCPYIINFFYTFAIQRSSILYRTRVIRKILEEFSLKDLVTRNYSILSRSAFSFILR
jgi:hypothetical protein